MAGPRLPLLRGRVSRTDLYVSPQPGFSPPIPSVEARAQKLRLLRQLDDIQHQIQGRTPGTRDEQATRELIAVRPVPGSELSAEQLDRDKADARLVGVVPETGVVLLDVADPQLKNLRDKIEAFADDGRVRTTTEKDGSVTIHRPGEQAIAPVASIGLAALDDVRGSRLRATTLDSARPYWFEIACRGGYREPTEFTQSSRGQVARQLYLLGADPLFEEFMGPEQVYFFVRLTPPQIKRLQSAADCIVEVELAPEPMRDLMLLDTVETKDIKAFSLSAPPVHAPAVVILDTGIATEHPLLKAAILSATKAGDLIPSVEDTHGHGTGMAGLALHSNLGAAIERGQAQAPHWLQSSRLLVRPGAGTASNENHELWPVLTLAAVQAAEGADPGSRDRVFALAVTLTMQDPPLAGLVPTLWSHSIDQIAHNEGRGRLIVVSAGNARDKQWLKLAQLFPRLQLSEKIHQPAQATNALTVGACTRRVRLPPSSKYREHQVVAQAPGGISPFTSTGLPGSEWAIKPDVVMEGGNLAISGTQTDPTVPTLCALTTGHRLTMGRPLAQTSMTSEATARAAHLAARVWAVEPGLWPETVRGLIVHSASWTSEMLKQFKGLSDRLLAVGYGLPDEGLARECAADRATVILEGVMPNAVIIEEPKKVPPKRKETKKTESKPRRSVKLYRLPVPMELLDPTDPNVELRITLSCIAEPNKFGSAVFHGLDLKWDMQGPQESEKEFLLRINALMRPVGLNGRRVKVPTKSSFNWEIGTQLRSRGTVQSDRWKGKMSDLAGDKLIAIIPVLGWWDRRKPLRTLEMRFSLIVSVFGPGVYAAIKPRVEVPVEVDVEVPV